MGMLKVANKPHYCDLPNEKWVEVDSKEEAEFTVPFPFGRSKTHYKRAVVYNTCRTEPPYQIGSLYECDECGTVYKVKPRGHGGNFIAVDTYWHKLGRIEAMIARLRRS